MIRTVANSVFWLVLSMGMVGTTEPPRPAGTKPVTVNFINSEGRQVGTALLTPATNGVKITLDIKNLPPGEHTLHIHQLPVCTPPDFKSAGPHFGAGHGHDSGGLPAGDIPNFVLGVNADGTAHTSVVAPSVTLGTDSNSVFSNGGTSIVIHATADQVTAAAPPRIACGIITRPE
jgi:superoxide dismutase, Cu-Zn family